VNTLIAWLDAVPAIVRIAFIFVLVLLAIKRKWALGNAMLAGAIGLGSIFGMGPMAIAGSAGASLLHLRTISLIVMVSLILVFSHVLEKTGQMGRLLEGFKGLIRSPRINLVIFPALIGLLPMPGGAIFSAPMVKNLGKAHDLSKSQLSYINYWFRHIWEYWWPLYPGILLTAALAGVNLWQLVLYTLPMTGVAITAGYWPLRGHVSAPPRTARAPKAAAPFFKELAPITCVIVLGLTIGVLFSFVLPAVIRPVAKEMGLIVALLVSITWVVRGNALSREKCIGILKDPGLIKMMYMVAAILIFEGVLENSQAVKQVSQEILRWNIPLMPIAMILPFLVGSVVGITIAFVGTTFPILISLIHAMGQGDHMLPYLMLSLTCGFVGVLLSPLHLCLLLSNAYFKTTLLPVYKQMVIPLIALVAGSGVYFQLLRYWME
jgi:uncharacterized protein